tara:strand:- start:2092 stop:2298 length:207 start_codon:yes stop_codon:yes gene_type:complete
MLASKLDTLEKIDFKELSTESFWWYHKKNIIETTIANRAKTKKKFLGQGLPTWAILIFSVGLSELGTY